MNQEQLKKLRIRELNPMFNYRFKRGKEFRMITEGIFKEVKDNGN